MKKFARIGTAVVSLFYMIFGPFDYDEGAIIRPNKGGVALATVAMQGLEAAPFDLDLGAPREDPRRQWTLMVYMDADNDLEAFALSDAIRTFPARHYGLILWDHGGGWSAHVQDIDAPGTRTGQDHLTLPELSEGIGKALKSTGLPRLDLVGFDMCLMAQIETAVELEGLAEVMVASQAVEPGDG